MLLSFGDTVIDEFLGIGTFPGGTAYNVAHTANYLSNLFNVQTYLVSRVGKDWGALTEGANNAPHFQTSNLNFKLQTFQTCSTLLFYSDPGNSEPNPPISIVTTVCLKSTPPIV